MTSPRSDPSPAPEAVRADFEAYIHELVAQCHGNPLITGLILMGSTAERARVDQWSDHDFAVVCTPGADEQLRGDLTWLPRSPSLVATAREFHDGFKAVYRDGSVVEFAVVDAEGLGTFHANAFEVAYDDDGGLEGVMRAVSRKTLPGSEPEPMRDMTVLLASILIGVGRARRGETLSASGSIRGLGLEHLLKLLAHFVPTEHPELLDTLDPRRRFESAFPSVGSALAAALDSPIECCGEQLLDIANEQLTRRWEDYPVLAEESVRRRLGWSQPSAFDTGRAR